MKNYIHTVLHPELYHEGWLKPPFFEGWYLKVVDASQHNAWAFIVGVFRQPEVEKSEAFIQVLEGNTGKVYVFTYSYTAFLSNPDRFEVKLAENLFSLNGMQINLKNTEVEISGVLKFEKGKSWPVHWYSPGIMGPFGWINHMECYHGLVSFDHEITGDLFINSEKQSFNGGRGYIEKDFGKAFPLSWIWLQTNHFSKEKTSLSASIAVIPFLGLRFKGVIIGLWHEERLYAFTTYNGSRIKSISIGENSVNLVVKRGQWRLELVAERVGGGILKAPVPTGMDRRIVESLNAHINIKLWKKDQLLLDDVGYRAGMEIVGDMNLIGK